MNERHGERPDRPESEPAPTITSKARTARWYDRRQGNTLPGGARRMVPLRPDSDPAPTIGAMGLATGRDVWVYRDGRSEEFQRTPRRGDEPATILGTRADLAAWHPVADLPATTIGGDPRMSARNHHEDGSQGARPSSSSSSSVRDGEYEEGRPIKVTIEEASILQGFPADYPWKGSRSKQFEQIGNAVPPPFARAIIEALLGSEVLEGAA